MKTTAKKKSSPAALAQTILRWLKKNEIENQGIAVAVSGGVDSIVLLHVLCQWQRRLGLEITVVHVNHGHLKRRRDAQNFVAQLCADKGLRFLANSAPPTKRLKSEEELRDFRWSTIEDLLLANSKAQQGCTVATAHHRDDLIETQLLRLLRGTGLQGLKGAQVGRANRVQKIRPLATVGRTEILAYAKANKLEWFEDPSNSRVEPLRNWLRQKWLAPLERKNAGLKTSLARSLDLLSNTKPAMSSEFAAGLIEQNKINLQEFLKLTRDHKEAALAYYMHKLNLRNYSKNHIAEILKQLDTGRRELSFKLLQREWFINAQHIFCQSTHKDT